MLRLIHKFPSLPYLLPFVVFITFLGLHSVLGLSLEYEYPLRIALVALVLLVAPPQTQSWQASRPIESVLVGILGFVIWVLPDVMWPSYRHHWLFQNSIIGTATSSIPMNLRSSAVFIMFRLIGTAVIVPIIEELFWRGWLMRYLIDSDFRTVPLGTYFRASFWLTAILFASEHGSFWDVGLIAGIAYNWWMLRTKSLFDCVLAHAVTNASLAVYVVRFEHWQYWL